MGQRDKIVLRKERPGAAWAGCIKLVSVVGMLAQAALQMAEIAVSSIHTYITITPGLADFEGLYNFFTEFLFLPLFIVSDRMLA